MREGRHSPLCVEQDLQKTYLDAINRCHVFFEAAKGEIWTLISTFSVAKIQSTDQRIEKDQNELDLMSASAERLRASAPSEEKKKKIEGMPAGVCNGFHLLSDLSLRSYVCDSCVHTAVWFIEQ